MSGIVSWIEERIRRIPSAPRYYWQQVRRFWESGGNTTQVFGPNKMHGQDMPLRFMLARLLVSVLLKLETDWANPSDVYFCYRLLLGRRPEDGGWKHWLGRVRSGMRRSDLVDSFLCSEEFRKRYELSPAVTPTCVRTDDFVIYVDADDLFIGRPIAQYRTYESHVTTFVKRELRANDTFVDIGANMGWYTLVAASLFQSGKVISIEPNHTNLQCLYGSIIANGLKNVTVYPYAVTDKHVILQLHSVRSNGSVSQIGGVSDSGSYVPGIRLDDLLKDEPRIDMIKIDIEGHEPIALRGMQELIRKHRPLIVTEFNPKTIEENSNMEPADYLQALMSLGYRLAVLQGDSSEIPFSDKNDILDYWRDLNRRLGTDDMTFLDLIARPI